MSLERGTLVAVVLFRRPARRDAPPAVFGQVEVRPPPAAAPQAVGTSVWWVLLPAVAGLTGVVMILVGGGSGIVVTAGVLVGMSVLAMAGGLLVRVGGDRARRIDGERRAYFRHLAQVRRTARSAAAEQAEALFWLHPDPRGLPSLIRTSRLWERRPGDPDFGVVRLGLGDQPLALDLQLGHPSSTEDDAVSAGALHRMLRTQGTVRMLPVVLSLRSFGRVRLEGNPVAGRQLATAMVLQAITWHAPDEFRLALCVDAEGMRAWDWLKWAPHLADPSVPPTDLPRFTVSSTVAGLAELLSGEWADRPPVTGAATDRGHLLIVIDGGSVGGASRFTTGPGLQGVTMLDLSGVVPVPPGARGVRLRVTTDDLLAIGVDAAGHEVPSYLGRPDRVGAGEAAAVGRGLAGIRIPDDADADQPLITSTGLTDLIGVADIRTLSPGSAWRPRQGRDLLRVPIGVGTSGQAVEVDLKQAAAGGMGPHGLIVGTAGSGKSELLRTLVLGLAIRHPPEVLNVVLVDVEGSTTFAPLAALPHTSAVISGLTDELGLVDRLVDAITGELRRRSDQLESAGGFAPPPGYDRASALAPDRPRVPALVIVIDGVSALVSARPDILDQLITVARVGGPLGVHLLLTARHLDEGGLGDLHEHLTYRIALRTSTAAASRVVLGAPDAVDLPTTPGNGYLVFDDTGLVRFKDAYVSGPVRDTRPGADHLGWVDPQVFRLSAAPARAARDLAATVGPNPDPTTPPDTDSPADQADGRLSATPTLLDVAVSRLTGSGAPAQEFWLPPLTDPPPLDRLLPAAAVQPATTVGGPATPGSLTVPLGWVDRPVDRSRDLLTVDLSGPAWHLAVVGAPGSGRSTALRSLISALALTNGPTEIGFYCLDFGGGSLADLSGLPQVAVVAGPGQPALVSSTVELIERIVVTRESAAAGPVDEQWRRGDPAADGWPTDVIVMIDDWAAARHFDEPGATRLLSVAARGTSVGIHLVLAADQWSQLPAAVIELIGCRIELWLDDPSTSMIDPALAAGVPRRPGRGLTGDRLHLLTAVPRIDGESSTDGLTEATTELVGLVSRRWSGAIRTPANHAEVPLRPALDPQEW